MHTTSGLEDLIKTKEEKVQSCLLFFLKILNDQKSSRMMMCFFSSDWKEKLTWLLELCLVGKVAFKHIHLAVLRESLWSTLEAFRKNREKGELHLKCTLLCYSLFSFYMIEKQESTVWVLDTLQVTAVPCIILLGELILPCGVGDCIVINSLLSDYFKKKACSGCAC